MNEFYKDYNEPWNQDPYQPSRISLECHCCGFCASVAHMFHAIVAWVFLRHQPYGLRGVDLNSHCWPWKAGCFYTAIRSIPPKKKSLAWTIPPIFFCSKLWTAQIASSPHIFTNDPTFWPKNISAFQEGLVLEFYRILVEICRPKKPWWF